MKRGETRQSDRKLLPIALQWIALLIILCVASLRIVTSFADAVVFDVDPTLDPTPFAGLGPPGTLWLDCIVFAAGGLFLFGNWLERRAIDWLVVTLPFIPLVVVLWHGYRDLGDLRKGTVWAAGAIAAAVMAHARKNKAMRIAIIMVLAGIGGPLVVRGACNVTYEYTDTLAMYQQQKELILADKGWDAESASAKIYERRLEKREPTAWFTTTNIFGSFMAASVVLWLGLGFAGVRSKLSSGWPGLCAIFAAACGAGLYMTNSAGALGACVVGVGFLAVLCATTLTNAPFSSKFQRAAPLFALLLVAGALLGIVAHGVLFGNTSHANTSLLFRWHYIISASRIFAHHPLLGVGPDEFQAEYMLARVPSNPEEVASAHSMFFDWLATLGIIAVAWIGLVAYLLRRAAAGQVRTANDRQSNDTKFPITPVGATAVIGIIAILGVAPGIIWERHILDILSWTMRIVGVLGFCAGAAAAGHIAARAPSRIIDITLLCAALALVVHGQIEMTWIRPSSVVMAFIFLGAAATAADRRFAPLGLVQSITLFAKAIWLAVTGAIPATHLQNRMIDAASVLWPAARAKQSHIAFISSMNEGHVELARKYLARRDDALRELGITIPSESLDWDGLQSLLKPVLIERRQQAGDILLDAYEKWPVTEDPVSAASKQIGLASEDMQMPQRVPVLVRSLELAEQSAARHRDVVSASRAQGMRLKMYELTGDHAHVEKAIEWAEYLTTQDPLGIRAWVSLGNVLWDDEQYKRAAEAYRKAIEHSDNFKLDSFKQLPVEERAMIESRIAEAETRE